MGNIVPSLSTPALSIFLKLQGGGVRGVQRRAAFLTTGAYELFSLVSTEASVHNLRIIIYMRPKRVTYGWYSRMRIDGEIGSVF
jgi:hypothetical protein